MVKANIWSSARMGECAVVLVEPDAKENNNTSRAPDNYMATSITKTNFPGNHQSTPGNDYDLFHQ